jgi:hypothetical protein
VSVTRICTPTAARLLADDELDTGQHADQRKPAILQLHQVRLEFREIADVVDALHQRGTGVRIS